MKQRKNALNENKTIRWPYLYLPLCFAILVLIMSTVWWANNMKTASEQMVNALGEFYLEEITERNAAYIESELENKTELMEHALTVLDAGHVCHGRRRGDGLYGRQLFFRYFQIRLSF